MASANSDYIQGSMPVEAQSRTFSGFMNLTVYGSCLIVFLLLYPTLVFSTALTWLPSLVIAAVVGILLGVVFKLKGAWFATIIGLSILLAVAAPVLIWLRSLAG